MHSQLNGNPLENEYVSHVRSLFTSADPAVRAKVRAANEALVAKALTPGSVHVDQTLSNLSIRYANPEYIGLQLLPVVNVNSLSAVYFKYDRRTDLAYPDDAMYARSSPNELTENVTRANIALAPYGYKEYLDNLTLANQSEPLLGMVDVMAHLNEALAFREELRIAAIMTDTANYAGNTTALGSGDKWNEDAADPIAQIMDAKATLWQGRGPTRLVGFGSQNIYNALIRQAKVRAQFGSGANGKIPTKQELLDLLGLDDILVSDARKDTANAAQAASYARIWGDVFGIVRVARAPSTRSAAFGFTFRMGGKDTDQWYDPTVGPRGGYYGRVSLVEGHHVVAGDTGHLFTSLLA